MKKTSHVLLILWSFLQTALSVYFLWGFIILIRLKNIESLLLFLLPTVLINLMVAYLSVYVCREIQKGKKNRMLFKTASNFIIAPFKFIVHLIVLILGRLKKLKISYGGFDNDNKASIFVYALSYIDFEPLWGDFKDKEKEDDRRPMWAKALKDSLFAEEKHILALQNEKSRQKKADSADVFEKAEAVCFICSSKVEVFGNEVTIDLYPIMNRNVITFVFALKPACFRYSSTEETQVFQEQVKKKIQAIQETVLDMMIQWADIRQLDRNYEIIFGIEEEN